MKRYDFVKTIGIISCKESNDEILNKIEKKKRHLKSDISNIDKELANTAYYIDGDAKRYIFFNITPDFIKYIAFKYERTSFVSVSITNNGLEKNKIWNNPRLGGTLISKWQNGATLLKRICKTIALHTRTIDTI